MWGGENKKARVRWQIMTKHPNEGGTGIKDPIAILDAAKINMKLKTDHQSQATMDAVDRNKINKNSRQMGN